MKHRFSRVLAATALAVTAILLAMGALAAEYTRGDLGYDSNGHEYYLDGTVLDLTGGTITIKTEQDFRNFQDFVNHHVADDYSAVTWELGCDLNLSLSGPVGISGYPFRGIFNGNNRTITLPSVSDNTSGALGLFGYAKDATIQDLTVSGSSVSNTLTSSNNSTGGIVGEADNCIIYNCMVVNLSLSGTQNVGGIAGIAKNHCTITKCKFTNGTSVTAAHQKVGGIAGYAEDSTIQNCENNGAVTVSGGGGDGDAGGIVGYIVSSAGNDTNVTIENCDNYGVVTASGGGSNIGGIVGYAEKTTIDLCENNGTVTSSGSGSDVGGIVGYCKSGSIIQNCENHGAASSANGSKVGGIVGSTESINRIEACSNTATITSTHQSGGIAGQLSGGKQVILGCRNLGNVAAATGSGHAGGIAGGIDSMNSFNISIEKCYHIKDSSNTTGIITGIKTHSICPDAEEAEQLTLTDCFGNDLQMDISSPGYTYIVDDWLRAYPTPAKIQKLGWNRLSNDSDPYPLFDSTHAPTSLSIYDDGDWAAFAELADDYPAVDVLLRNNITLGANGTYTPIGTQGKPFVGKLTGDLPDGNLPKITLGGKNAAVSSGLFGYLGSGASISNIMVDATINLNSNSNVGILANNVTADAGASVEHCITKGSITTTADNGSGQCVGGMVGYASGLSIAIDYEFADLYRNEAVISSTAENVGGLVGKSLNSSLGGNNAGAVTYVYTNSASSAYVGGIVGYADKGTCICQNNTAAVTMSGVPDTATAFYAGGVAGCYDGGTTGAYIESSANNTAAVSGASYSGLSVGYWKSGNVGNRYSVGGQATGHFSVANAAVGLAPLTANVYYPRLFAVMPGYDPADIQIDGDQNWVTTYVPSASVLLRIGITDSSADGEEYLSYVRDYQVTCTDASGNTCAPDEITDLPEGTYAQGVSFSNLPAGTYTFAITGQGGYYGEVQRTLIVKGQPAKLTAVAVDTFLPVYSGEAIVPEQEDVKIYSNSYYDGETAVEGVSFEVDTESGLPYDNVNASTVTLPIKVTGNYIGTTTVTYTIAKRTLTAADVVFYQDGETVNALTYIHGTQSFCAQVLGVDGEPLPDDDVTITYQDAKGTVLTPKDGTVFVEDAGEYTAVIEVNEGCVNYKAEGNITKTLTVAPLTVTDSPDCPVEIRNTAPVYTGEAFRPDALVTAYWEEGPISADWYTVTCAKEIRAAGSYTLQVAFAGGSLTGTLEHTVQVQPRPITASEITVSPLPEMSFTGLVHAVGEDAVITDGEKQLTAQTDYTWSYYADIGCKEMLEETDVRNAGTYYLKVEGAGNYGSFRVVSFQIGQIALEYGSAFSLEDHYFVLENSPVRPTPQFHYEDAAHFQVTYANNTQPGTASMTVRALSTAVNYVPGSEVTVAYTILADEKDRVQAIVEKYFEAAPAGINTFELAIGGSDIPAGVYNLPTPAKDTPCLYVTVRKRSTLPDAPQTTVTDTTKYRPGVPVYLRADTQYTLEFHY